MSSLIPWSGPPHDCNPRAREPWRETIECRAALHHLCERIVHDRTGCSPCKCYCGHGSDPAELRDQPIHPAQPEENIAA